MSGLEKFQTSEAWRTNFKKFLLMERKPEVVQSRLTATESQRYSLDISDELKNIIEQKRNQKPKNYQQPEENILTAEVNDKINMKTSDESCEFPEMCEKTVSYSKSSSTEDEQKSNNILGWHRTSDESFEALERMCDKTASDPNSTLFQYLHSDHKEQVLAEVKKRSTDGNNIDNLLINVNNCTLLDDIEAPSRIWENTICGDTILQTSPVKIVGLLRPSTIIEETPDDSANSDISSQTSFHTATKSAQSDVSSSAYETGNDFTDANNKCFFQEVDVFDVDQILLNALAKNDQAQGIEDKFIQSLKIMDTTIFERALSSNNSKENNANTSAVSVDLIDLEKTFAPLHDSLHSILEESRDKQAEHIENELESKVDSYNLLGDSVIEIISDDEEYEIEDKLSCNEKQKLHNIKTEMVSKTSSLNIIHDTYGSNEYYESNKENFGETDELSEKSVQFNDTMEEVEYMLKKGLEYMAAEAEKNKAPPVCSNQVTGANTNLSIKHIDTVKHVQTSASKAKSSANRTPGKSSAYTTPAKETPLPRDHKSASKLFDIGIKPFPKLDIFAKPAQHTRTKEHTGKQQKFCHIVSPIGTYMKKTAQTPLMSSINCKNKDYFNSTAILELENESRLYQPQFVTDLNKVGLPKLPGVLSGAKQPLPKKAYISSDLKHIVDERTPVTIPGGKKIQKYLENAMMPAVLRHEGKLKMPSGISNKLNSSTAYSSEVPSKLPLRVSNTNSKVSSLASHVPPCNNASLADLSLMSGDVSMYTIMDAQKF